ncbi:maestro heat-like repeat-containing protein family member 7 [Caretta caretta]|uniref:maestro heat-like repeat-containing protein family member 7 n=1 Tax=Caretta caretta TaxID=8467 RepID=UPI003F4C1387
MKQVLIVQRRVWISAEFPKMGHHVAQLALFVSDPDKDISRQAREGTYRLYQLLLQQRGLTIHDAEDLWCYDWHQDSRLLGYKNTARVGEVFGKFFCNGQKRSFLQTAVLAIHDPLLRVSQAGLVLVYSLLGEAQQLMGVTVSSCNRLRSLGWGPGPHSHPIAIPWPGSKEPSGDFWTSWTSRLRMWCSAITPGKDRRVP